jgi:hypothetical protein
MIEYCTTFSSSPLSSSVVEKTCETKECLAELLDSCNVSILYGVSRKRNVEAVRLYAISNSVYPLYMSSIAAAKRRRAGEQTPPPLPPQQQQSQPSTPQPRMTLPQVLAMIDSRLVQLETSVQTVQPIPEEDGAKASVNEYISEMDAKFNLLVEEITNLKETVMKLQTYTMDVNKMLLENRSQIPDTD